MVEKEVVPGSAIGVQVTFDCNARYSIYLFKWKAGGDWTNAPLKADAFVIGTGTATYAAGAIPGQSRWAIVVSANLTPTDAPGDVSCDVQLLVDSASELGQNASGTVTNPDGYLPRQVRIDVFSK
jgi:hypothetical protein